MYRIIAAIALTGIVALNSSTPVAAQAATRVLPIFDVHIHYHDHIWKGTALREFQLHEAVSRGCLEQRSEHMVVCRAKPGEAIEPKYAFKLLDKANVTRILVSSWPGEGTSKLYNFAPKRVVAGLALYHEDSIMSPFDRFTWMNDKKVPQLIREKLEKKDLPYKTIGEFHAQFDQELTPTMIEIAKIARDKNLVLHAHAHHGAVEKWLKAVPSVKILWAHAGFVCGDPCPEGATKHLPGADVVQDLLDSFPDNLYIELSYRDSSGAPIAEKGKPLPKAWKDIIRSHPKNVMLGSDTYVRERWEHLVAIENEMRGWLMDPEMAEFAEDVAHGNAERLFGP
jgi:hypothetical protein